MTLLLVASGSVEVHAIKWQKRYLNYHLEISVISAIEGKSLDDYIVAAIKHSSKSMEYYEICCLFLNMLGTWGNKLKSLVL